MLKLGDVLESDGLLPEKTSINTIQIRKTEQKNGRYRGVQDKGHPEEIVGRGVTRGQR